MRPGSSHSPLVALIASVGGACLVVAGSSWVAPSALAQPSGWAPRAVVRPAFLGSVSTVQVEFTASADLTDVQFRVVPALAPYVSVLNADGVAIPAGQATTVTLLLSVPRDAPLARVDGTIHVVSGRRGTVAPPLPFTLEIHPPGPPIQTVGPEGGVFGFPEGVVLEIPPAAVATWTDITITPLSCADVDAVLATQLSFGYQRRCLGGFTAEPDGLVFAHPITAWMPLSSSLGPTEFPTLVAVDLDAGTVVPLAAQLTHWGFARTLETTVQHFSKPVAQGVSALPSDAERQCRTCAGYLEPACQAFNDDPHGQAWCLLRSADRLSCGVPGACCKELGVRVTTSATDTASGQCEVTGSAVQVSFPFCPGGEQVEVDVQYAVNCPGDWTFEAAVRPAKVSLYVCQAQTLEAVLLGTSADGSRMLPPAPTVARWESDDSRLSLSETLSSAVTAQALQPSPFPINVLATVNSTDPILRGVSHVTIVEPDISIEALDGRPVNPLAMRPGDSVDLRVVLPTGFDNEAWSSRDPAVATVDAFSGVVTAADPGSTTVDVELTYAIGECQHTVRAQVAVAVGPRIPHHVEIDPPSGSVRLNGTLDLTAIVFDQYSQPIPDVPVQWQIASGTGTIELTSAEALPPRATVRGLTPGEGRVAATVPEAPDALPGYSDITVDPVDAFITISPLTGTVPIGGPHVLTARVEADAGAGLVSAPAGTMIDFAIVNGPGAFDATTCVTAGETGSCSVTMTSGLAGVTVIRAATTIVVGGVPLTRVTDGVGRNSASATVEIVQKDKDIDFAINPAVASLTVRTSIAISATNALGERVRATWESSDPQTVTVTPVADGLLASVFAVRLDPPETARTVAISATVEDQSAVAHITVLPGLGGNRIRGRVWRDDGDRLFTFRIPNPGQRADVPGAFTGIRLVSTTGHVSRTTTDQTGQFVFANLDDGTYTITCEACETAHLAAWNRTSVTLPLSGWHGRDVILDFMAPLASIAAVPVDLGHLDNRFPGDGATATAINQSGDIVGRSQVYMPSVDVSGHPGHWRCQVSFLVIAGIMTSLGTQCPSATGISDHGSVVGTCYTRSGPPDPDVDSEFGPCGIPRSQWSQRAIWMPGGAPNFLGSTTDLSFQVQGVRVNAQGAVVGRDETGTFVWRDGTKSYLPVPGNFSPSDINRHGHVLGILDRAGMFPRRVPALWIAETGLIEFGHGNLEFREDLLVLNDDDRIVGFSALYAALFDRERRDGALLIGAFPSRGMNNFMHVVGLGGNAAVLWTPDTGPVLLPQLVPGQSCSASDVNDARQVAGTCQVTSGQSHAVRWDYIIVEQ